MTNLKTITALCGICEELVRLVSELATRNAELGDVALSERIAAAKEHYAEVIGGEWPDAYPREDTR